MINVVDPFFDTGLFAEAASYAPASGSVAESVAGLFTPAYALSVIGNVTFQNTAQTFHCRTSDVSAATPDSTLTLRGQLYWVHENKPDGTGITVLTLGETKAGA